jgi:hypothetical protein
MRRRRAALALLCVLVLPVVAACSVQSTPVCDQAAKLVDGHHLGAALSRYVDAGRAGEGGCAADGQSEVEDRQSKVALVVAQATSAERRGDVKGAEDLYVQALTQDVDNAPARAALARLQLAQSGPSASPSPSATPRSSASDGGGNDPVVVILVTVVLLVAIATGIIAALVHQRDRPRPAQPAALPRLRGGEAPGRLERLEANVAFLLEAVERLAAASPVPRVRTEYVAPRRGPEDPDRTTTVSAVTVVRLRDDGDPGALLVVCRRLVNEAARPADELLADIARLGTPDAPHLEILLEEVAIAAATTGLLDPTWRVVEEAWQVEDGGDDLVAGQVRELVVGRPVVLPATATTLPDPLGAFARQVAGQVATPGAELPGPARVLLHATGVAARPPQGNSVLLTAAVRWLMYDVTADAVVRGLRNGLQPPSDAGEPPPDAGGASPQLPSGGPSAGGVEGTRHDEVRRQDEASRQDGGDRQDEASRQDERQVATRTGIAHLLEHPRRPGAPPRRA